MAGAPVLLSLCMIVKNEEKNIVLCLQSIEDLVDEIVLIDTGSEDKTIQKAKKFGVKTYNFPWQNNFSAARNYALRKTKGQWILVLDADERLEKVSPYLLRQTLSKAKEEGFYVAVYNYQGKNQGYTRSYSLRLFRNHPLYRYTGKIHEQILPSIKKNNPQALIGWSQLIIHHDGYLKEAVTLKDKAERNLEILLNESQDVKNTPFYNLNLAMEYLRLGQLLEAETKLREGWETVNIHDSYAHCLLLKLIACLHAERKDREALVYCHQGLEHYPDFADIYYYYGICLMKTGDSEEAKRILLRGLLQGESPKKYISQSGCGSYLNLCALAQIEEERSSFETASAYYLQALRLQPNHLPYLKRLIKVLLKSDLDKKSYLAMHNLLSKEYVSTIVQTAYILHYYSFVLEILSEWQGAACDWELQLIQGKSLMRLRNYQEALARLETIPSQNPLKRDGLLYSWLCAILEENFSLAAKYTIELEQHENKLSKLLTQIQNCLQYADKTVDFHDHALFKNNESVLAILTIIDNLASCQAEKYLNQVVDFLLELTGEAFKPLLQKILSSKEAAAPC